MILSLALDASIGRDCLQNEKDIGVAMANVSDLLNPAPTSSEPSQPSRPQPLNMGSQSPHHVRKDSISSPGLDALAGAASTADPLISPTDSSSFSATGLQSGFRRPSGGAQSYERHQAPSQIYSNYPQYNRPSSSEQRPTSSSSQTLPPYQSSGLDQLVRY